MKQINNTLFALNKNDTYQQWKVFVDGANVIVEFGREGGKIQTKITTCTPKNVGRANETTAEQQALLEAKSKWEKQVRLGYREDKSSLTNTPVISPMLAADATKKSHMIKYPCYISQKLDGLRVLVTFDEDGEPVFNSRGNKTYPIQGKLIEQMKELRRLSGFDVFDGELYIHGLLLQKITSLSKKWKSKEDIDKEINKEYMKEYSKWKSSPKKYSPPEPDTLKYGGYCSDDLEYHIFDIPSELPFWAESGDSDGWDSPTTRESALTQVDHIIIDSEYVPNEYSEIPLYHLKVVLGRLAEDEDDVKESIGSYMSQGYEGTIIRNFEGKYEYGQRSNDLLKWKLFQDTEAEVVDVEEDKNGEGVLICRDREGVIVRLKMKGTHQDRIYKNQLKNVGKWVNFTFQTRTEDNNYQFPVGVGFRAVNKETKEVEE